VEGISDTIGHDYTYHEGGCPSSLAGEHLVGGCINPTGSISWFYTAYLQQEVSKCLILCKLCVCVPPEKVFLSKSTLFPRAGDPYHELKKEIEALRGKASVAA